MRPHALRITDLFTITTLSVIAQGRSGRQAAGKGQSHRAGQQASQAGAGSSAGQAVGIQQRDHVREQVRTVEQQHERMMQTFNNDHKGAVRQNTRSVQQIEERVNTRLQQMDQELEKSAPDPKRIAEQPRATEREMSQWRIQHQQMAEYLGLNSNPEKER